MRLLVIRPQPGADATANRIQALGLTAVLMPLFEIRSVDWAVPPTDVYDALILSSGNSVRHAGPGLQALKALPIFTVGSATARAAEDAGLQVEVTGRADFEALMLAACHIGHGRLLWLAGEDRTAVAVPDGVTLDICIVYKSAAMPAPAGFDESVLGADIALLHSQRAARHFAELCDAHALDRSHIVLGALSPAIAESAGSGWKQLLTASAPNDAALLSEAQSYFTNTNRDP